MNEGTMIFLSLVGIILACIYIGWFIDSIKKIKEESAATNRYLRYLAYLISKQAPPDLSEEELDFLKPKSNSSSKKQTLINAIGVNINKRENTF